MPLTSFLAAPGSPIRLVGCATGLKRPTPFNTFFQPQPCLPARTGRRLPHQNHSNVSELALEPWTSHEARAESTHKRKRKRLSRPAAVLQSIQTSARNMYRVPNASNDKSNLKGDTTTSLIQEERSLAMEPVSLYSIVARYLHHHTGPHYHESGFALTSVEKKVLRSKGYTQASVEKWATSLLEPKSLAALDILAPNRKPPPLFLISLLLRRQHLSAFALGAVLRHVGERVKSESLTWTHLKLLSIRLVRHARILWPESIPWIASLFAVEANRLFGDNMSDASPKMLSDITHFCNTFLHLLSLPAKINPVIGAVHQEKAQFKVLQFMANQSPPVTVTRLGFRSVSRVQLAHAKTAEEREWAELKGPSWPPWKENRTAMDEDKGYAYGASRASKILHRMYEAGYRGHTWEEMLEVYAGWDTDLSPTIQTRTSLPHVSPNFKGEKYLTSLLWAGRVTTTRTRREAWACFLAYEASGASPSPLVYLAMFEKLRYHQLERSTKHLYQSGLSEELRTEVSSDGVEGDLLPGDMKEVLPDHASSFRDVYVSEPIPTMEELQHRMLKQNIRPSNRLLAFLSYTTTSFETCIDVFEAAKEGFNGGIGCLLSGKHDNDSPISQVPGYLLAAFIGCLCRYGHFARTPPENPIFLSPERHAYQFKHNRHYLLDYAYALLVRYRPMYKPAWTTYIEKVVRTNVKRQRRTLTDDGISQYETVWKLIESMEQIDLDVDDRTFICVCIATTYAAQSAKKNLATTGDVQSIFVTASPRLRRLFNSLVGANIDVQVGGPSQSREHLQNIPSHIPSPAELHAYVRALGVLHDFEGLYSFSTWLAAHHVEVTARCEAQHSGIKSLFKTLVALRAAVTGYLEEDVDQQYRASDDIVQLIKSQIEHVREWGGWPTQKHVDLYIKRALKNAPPKVGGR